MKKAANYAGNLNCRFTSRVYRLATYPAENAAWLMPDTNPSQTQILSETSPYVKFPHPGLHFATPNLASGLFIEVLPGVQLALCIVNLAVAPE